MKFISFLVVCFWSNCTIAQSLQTAWVKSVSGSLYEESSSFAQAPCGDLYMVGFFQQDFGGLAVIGGEEGFIAKYNDQGQLLWLKQLAGTSLDRINGVVVGNDHEIYLVGEFRGIYHYNNDSLVSTNSLDGLMIKIDSSGDVQWAKSMGGSAYDSATKVALYSNGDIGVTGYFENTLMWGTSSVQSFGLRDIFTARVDPQGNLQWLKSFGGPGYDESRFISSDLNDNSYVVGSFRDFIYLPNDTIVGFGGKDIFLAKYNSLGILQWIKVMGGPSSDEGMQVKVDNNQDIVVVGWYDRSIQILNLNLPGVAEEDGFAAKFDSTGAILWAETLGGDFDERIYGLDFDGANNIYFMGTLDSMMILGGDTLSNRHLNRPTDIYIAKYSSAGIYQWAQTLGHYYNDFCTGILVKDATTIYLTGGFQDTTIFVNDTLYAGGQYDVFLAKFEIDSTVAIHKIPNQNELDISTIKLFPNPSANQSTLVYQLKKASKVQISLYDVLSHQVAVMLDENQSEGAYQIPIYKNNLASGMYLLYIKTEEGAVVLKLVFD